MIYAYTEDNIRTFLQSVGAVEKAQLIRFFSDELQPVRVEHILNTLAIEHAVNYDETSGLFSAIGYEEVDSETQSRRTLCLWAIAAMGSNGVSEAMTVRFPSQFLVITPESATFDFTVVETPLEAATASRIFREGLTRGSRDDINHVAVLRRPSDAESLMPALATTGFGCICTIDPETKRPTYTVIEKNITSEEA